MVTAARQWLGLIGVSACSFGAGAQTTINDAIVITEFFEGFQLVDPSGPGTTQLGLSAANPLGVPSFPSQLLVEASGTILFTDMFGLRRLDPATGLISDVAPMPSGFTLQSIALEADGNVIANDASEVYRIDATTGQVDVFDNDFTFFGPRAVSVAANGDIFITEFHEDIYKINPVTGDYTLVPTDGAFAIPGLVEVLPSGDLAIWDFPNGLFVFDPDTGNSTPVPTSLTSASGTAIGSSGEYLVANSDGVFEIDLVTGVATQLTPDDTFFSPIDVAQGTITIPEPASAGLLLVGLGMVGRRRR